VQLDVSIQLHHPRWKALLKPYCKTVRAVCEATLAPTALARLSCGWEMAVVLADDAFVRELNHAYRGQDKATNVLSFPSVEKLEANAKKLCKGADSFAIGDVVLAVETLEREADEQKKPVKHHAIHLLVHGTLHLLGHDHMRAKEAQSMEALEVKILKKLGVSNPYL